jgi:ATP-dependent DNA ligase
MRRFLPEQLDPQACEDADDVADAVGQAREPLTMNPKLDGYRLICVVEDDHVDMMSRGLKWQDGKLPDLECALLARFPAGTVLDGEITAIREVTIDEMAAGDGRRVINDFERVASVMQSNADKAVMRQRTGGALTYWCFDLLMLDGEDLTDLPLASRLTRLNDHLADRQPGDINFQLAPYVDATQENHDGFVRAGFEGTVVKALSAPYAFAQRGRGWWKIKAQWTMDVVITGFKPGKGQHTGKVGAFSFGQYLDGRLVERGNARGFSNAIMEAMTDHPEQWLGTVVEIGHNGAIGTSGKVRHPRFYRTRPDKQATDCDWRIR